MNVIEMVGVTRRYPPNVLALDGLDLCIPEGAIYGLLGRNGAGKTTALRVAMAMLHPHSGTVRVFEKDPWKYQEETKARIGYLSEEQALPQRLRVREIFSFYGSCYPTWDSAMVDHLVERFSLRTDAYLGRLSKGQQRQVGLICAVAHRPELLILDEPAGGLDVVVRRGFLEAIIELLNAQGGTVVFSSHLLGDVERMASHVGFIDNGKLILEASLDELEENYSRVHFKALSAAELQSLRSLPEYVATSSHVGDGVVVSLRISPEAVEEGIREHVEESPAQVARATLEDIFIDLVGDVT